MLSVYEFRLFFSLYSQRKYTRWEESTGRSSETELPRSQKACDAGKSQISRMLTGDRERQSQRETEKIREGENQTEGGEGERGEREKRERERMFGFLEVIWV